MIHGETPLDRDFCAPLAVPCFFQSKITFRYFFCALTQGGVKYLFLLEICGTSRPRLSEQRYLFPLHRGISTGHRCPANLEPILRAVIIVIQYLLVRNYGASSKFRRAYWRPSANDPMISWFAKGLANAPAINQLMMKYRY
jgi:hypothetical protein